MNFAGTFEEAMREVAERLVFRKTASPANDAQSARQALGILGATPGTIDSAVSRLNKGELSPGSAISKIRGAVPGTFSQIGNLPHGILAALRQGRPGDAVAQADIAGVKNIVPFSEHFSPTTALAAGAAGYGASKLQGMATDAKLVRDLLSGATPAHAEAMRYATSPTANKGSKAKGKGGSKPSTKYKLWDKWRLGLESTPNAAAPAPDGLLAKAKSGLGGVFNSLKTKFTQPELPVLRKETLNARPAIRLTSGDMARARKAYVGRAQKGVPVKTPGPGLLSRAAVPLAAAAVPLALKEWVGGGYRSGKKPAQELVAANQAMHEAPKSGLFDRVKKTFGGG